MLTRGFHALSCAIAGSQPGAAAPRPGADQQPHAQQAAHLWHGRTVSVSRHLTPCLSTSPLSPIILGCKAAGSDSALSTELCCLGFGACLQAGAAERCAGRQHAAPAPSSHASWLRPPGSWRKHSSSGGGEPHERARRVHALSLHQRVEMRGSQLGVRRCMVCGKSGVACKRAVGQTSWGIDSAELGRDRLYWRGIERGCLLRLTPQPWPGRCFSQYAVECLCTMASWLHCFSEQLAPMLWVPASFATCGGTSGP